MRSCPHALIALHAINPSKCPLTEGAHLSHLAKVALAGLPNVELPCFLLPTFYSLRVNHQVLPKSRDGELNFTPFSAGDFHAHLIYPFIQ